MTYKGSVYYRPLCFPEMWGHHMEELKENDIDYLNFGTRANMLVDEEVKTSLFRFLNTAGKYDIGCIYRTGVSLDLCLDPEVRDRNLTSCTGSAP